jgi:hypothetical protein
VASDGIILAEKLLGRNKHMDMIPYDYFPYKIRKIGYKQNNPGLLVSGFDLSTACMLKQTQEL